MMCHTVKLNKVEVLYDNGVIPHFDTPKKGCRVKCYPLHASIIGPHYLEKPFYQKIKKNNGKVPLEARS